MEDINTLSNNIIVRIIAATILAWMLREIWVYSIRRYHIIRGIRSELEIRLRDVLQTRLLSVEWCEGLLKCEKKSDVVMCGRQEPFFLYDSMHDKLASVLWFGEYKRLYLFYKRLMKVEIGMGEVADIYTRTKEKEFADKNSISVKLIHGHLLGAQRAASQIFENTAIASDLNFWGRVALASEDREFLSMIDEEDLCAFAGENKTEKFTSARNSLREVIRERARSAFYRRIYVYPIITILPTLVIILVIAFLISFLVVLPEPSAVTTAD